MTITFFPIKYCVACKKSTLKVLINLGFVTSFEDSHYILLFRYIYGAQFIQWFCYSKHERLSVDGPKEISADFAAICGRVSEHPILVLPSVFPIDESDRFAICSFQPIKFTENPANLQVTDQQRAAGIFLRGGGQNKKSHFTAIKSIQTGRKTSWLSTASPGDARLDLEHFFVHLVFFNILLLVLREGPGPTAWLRPSRSIVEIMTVGEM